MIHVLKTIKRSFFSVLFKEKLITVSDKKELENEVVIVVGATGAIGETITQVLHQKGARLMLVGRNNDKLNLLAKKYGPDRVDIISLDISHSQECMKVVKKTLEKFGTITSLINCAGAFSFQPLEKTSEAEWDRVMNVNFKGMASMCNAVTPHMKKQKAGCIINIGSKVSHNTAMLPERVLYATSKYAVEGFSFALRSELKPAGIRVCCLMPGTVYTYPTAGGDKLLSGYSIGAIIACIICQKDVDIESLVISSLYHSV